MTSKRVFISVDLEGMPYVVSFQHLFSGGRLFHEARKISTRIVCFVSKFLLERGYSVVLADSHGEMITVDPLELPRGVEIVRGFPRALSMVSGSNNCDFAIFLGYHAKKGSAKATFDHTYSSRTIRSISINDIEVSEYLLNLYTLGEKDIPVVLVGGDKALIDDDVKKFTPWVYGVIFKDSFSRYAAVSKSLENILDELRIGLERAISNYEGGHVKVVEVDKPIKLEIVFQNTSYADVAELLPGVHRVDGLSISYKTRSMEEVYRVLELLVLAASGLRMIEGRSYDER